MKLTVNGEPTQLEVHTLKELIREYDMDSNDNEKGMAVAVNDSVVPKEEWKEHKLEEHDRIEIIRATQGG